MKLNRRKIAVIKGNQQPVASGGSGVPEVEENKGSRK